MFGQPLLAELIFADIGPPVFVNPGWDKIPVPDCGKQDWEKIESSCAEADVLDKGAAEWTIVE